MIAIPNVDLRSGVCVQPGRSGHPDELVSADLPINVARSWANAGFRRVHVVDLDADSGSGSNAALVEDIIRDGAMDVQTSGGVETTEQIQRFAEAGATRIVLGPRAIEEPSWLATAADLFPGMLVVSTDIRERRVVTRGWVRTLPLDIFDVIEDLEGIPLGGLLVSALRFDGQRSSADLGLLEDIVESCAYPLIASGGVATLSDLRALEHRGVSAVLLGNALYSGEIDARAVAQEFCA
jgi:phosphoribosylformimino-5-aminoimidazole carboxamide ribotide isomerase